MPDPFHFASCEPVANPDPPPAEGWVRVRVLDGRFLGETFDLPAWRLTEVPPEPDAPFVAVNGWAFARDGDGWRDASRMGATVSYTWVELVTDALRANADPPRPLVYADGAE